MARALAGYSRLPGKSRNYRGPDGKEISRRAYDKLVAAAGKKTERAAPAASRSRVASAVYAKRAKNYAKQHGITVKEARNGAGLRKALKDLSSKDWRVQRDALKALGLREGIPDWVKPGESPGAKKSGAKTRKQYNAWKRGEK